MSVIALSSFSLHAVPGPLHLDVRDEDGNLGGLSEGRDHAPQL
jgi:hypothetical protein